jgi:phosphoenolpyruvate synthase/pyruvate phosphate dikinase
MEACDRVALPGEFCTPLAAADDRRCRGPQPVVRFRAHHELRLEQSADRLPAVVATGTATRDLATGQLIEVDGDCDNVRVLGLGESLVGGSVTPDSYILRKSDLSMDIRNIATKRGMTVLGVRGTREVDIPEAQQSRPAIEDSQVRDALQLALDLERRLGWPVDVECAWLHGLLCVLRCRPITTL